MFPTLSFPALVGSPTTITTSTTLTAVAGSYQQTQMTAIGQSVTLPDATTLSVGAPKFYIDNSKGGYPVGIRDSAGTLLRGVAAGGTAYVSLESASTAAGVWSVTGTNLEPGIIGIDTTLSSTYNSIIVTQWCSLDTNKSLHFAKIASGFAVFAVDKTTGTVGTPVTVSTASGSVPRSAFTITSTTAVVFYSTTTGTLISVVVSLSGATTLAVGTPSATLTDTGVGVENFINAPKIAQLDTTLYLVSWATATGAGNTSVAAFQVSAGTTITLGSTVNIIATNNCQDSTTTYALTATTGFVLYKAAASAPYLNRGVVVSVTNANPPVCTVGTPATLTGVSSSLTTEPSSAKLSATKIMVADDNNTAGSFIASVFTISTGTTTTAGTLVSVHTGAGTSADYITVPAATRYNPHITPLTATTALYILFDTTNTTSAGVVLTEAAGTVTAGTKVFGVTGCNTVSNPGGGYLAHTGSATEFCSVIQSDTAGADLSFMCNSINGTVIANGSVFPIPELSTNQPTIISATRITSGDYLLLGTSNTGVGKALRGIPVLRSNGTAINNRGSIKTPLLSLPYPTEYVAAVITGRVIIIGRTSTGANTGPVGSANPIRLISVEIAA